MKKSLLINCINPYSKKDTETGKYTLVNEDNTPDEISDLIKIANYQLTRECDEFDDLPKPIILSIFNVVAKSKSSKPELFAIIEILKIAIENFVFIEYQKIKQQSADNSSSSTETLTTSPSSRGLKMFDNTAETATIEKDSGAYFYELLGFILQEKIEDAEALRGNIFTSNPTRNIFGDNISASMYLAILGNLEVALNLIYNTNDFKELLAYSVKIESKFYLEQLYHYNSRHMGTLILMDEVREFASQLTYEDKSIIKTDAFKYFLPEEKHHQQKLLHEALLTQSQFLEMLRNKVETAELNEIFDLIKQPTEPVRITPDSMNTAPISVDHMVQTVYRHAAEVGNKEIFSTLLELGYYQDLPGSLKVHSSISPMLKIYENQYNKQYNNIKNEWEKIVAAGIESNSMPDVIAKKMADVVIKYNQKLPIYFLEKLPSLQSFCLQYLCNNPELKNDYSYTIPEFLNVKNKLREHIEELEQIRSKTLIASSNPPGYQEATSKNSRSPDSPPSYQEATKGQSPHPPSSSYRQRSGRR